MDAGEPHARRRGMFFHVETPDLDDAETESAEGLPIRAARRKPALAVQPTSAATARVDAMSIASRPKPRIRRPFRFATATDNRRLSHMSR